MEKFYLKQRSTKVEDKESSTKNNHPRTKLKENTSIQQNLDKVYSTISI